MRAMHLPAVADGATPPFSYPDRKAKPDALTFSTNIPFPEVPTNLSTHAYIIRVQRTALCKGELTWPEILERDRFRPFAGPIPGHDVVGTIEAVHRASSVTDPPKYKLGDHVWGLIYFDRDGAAADFALALENEIALTPTALPGQQPLSTTDLASLPLAGLTAYQALFTHSYLPPPKTTTTALTANPPSSSKKLHLLITGPTGTVGLLALQLASLLPPSTIHITAITSTRHLPFFTSCPNFFRINTLLDYTIPDFHLATALRSTHDLPPAELVLECAGGQLAADIILQDGVVSDQGGKIVSISGPLEGGLATLQPEVAERVRGKLKERQKGDSRMEFEFFIVQPDVAQLEVLGELYAQGRLRAFVHEEVFELERGREAMECVEGTTTCASGGGRKVGRGKVVIRVSD